MKILLIFCFSFFVFNANAQEISKQVIASAGGNASNADIQISWTLGESVIGTIATADGSLVLTQGFQQGYLMVTAVDDNLIDYKLSVYPNPTTQNLKIESKQSLSEISVLDNTGKLILTQRPNDNRTSIDFTVYQDGIYHLLIKDKDQRVATHKIVKASK